MLHERYLEENSWLREIFRKEDFPFSDDVDAPFRSNGGSVVPGESVHDLSLST